MRTQVDKAVIEIEQNVKASRRRSSEHDPIWMQHDQAFDYRPRPKHQVLQNRMVDGLAADRTNLTATCKNGPGAAM